MNDDPMASTVKKVIKVADDYAKLAVQNLVLEPTRKTLTDAISDPELVSFFDPLIDIMLKNPAASTPAKYFIPFKVMALFPNLDEKEREPLNNLAGAIFIIRLIKFNYPPKAVAYFADLKNRFLDSESFLKLTDVQLAILDTDMFNLEPGTPSK